jgi:hypothetical protein
VLRVVLQVLKGLVGAAFMPSSYLIWEHFDQFIKSQIQQGINSGPGRPVQEVAAELHARNTH